MEDTITCPDCAETIKREAKVCRFCGLRLDGSDAPSLPSDAEPLPEKESHKGPIIAALGFAVVGVGAAVFAGMYLDSTMDSRDYALEDRAKAVMVADLVDPESVRFSDINSNKNCAWGKINAKNRMGGYTGFQDFFYNARNGAARIEPDASAPPTLGGNSFDVFREKEKYLEEWSACTAA